MSTNILPIIGRPLAPLGSLADLGSLPRAKIPFQVAERLWNPVQQEPERKVKTQEAQEAWGTLSSDSTALALCRWCCPSSCQRCNEGDSTRPQNQAVRALELVPHIIQLLSPLSKPRTSAWGSWFISGSFDCCFDNAQEGAAFHRLPAHLTSSTAVEHALRKSNFFCASTSTVYPWLISCQPTLDLDSQDF